MGSFDSKKWISDIQSKMESVFHNRVRNLVNLAEGAKPIEYKHINKINIDVDGKLDVLESRLEAKGFLHVYGIYIL